MGSILLAATHPAATDPNGTEDTLMTTASAERSAVSSSAHYGDDDASGVVVYNCSRLGRTANPPRMSITDWFRRRR